MALHMMRFSSLTVMAFLAVEGGLSASAGKRCSGHKLCPNVRSCYSRFPVRTFLEGLPMQSGTI